MAKLNFFYKELITFCLIQKESRDATKSLAADL